MKRLHCQLLLAISATTCLTSPLHAKATADEIARIGTKYTCTGAEMAGSPSGVAPFTGKYLGAMPGMIPHSEGGAHQTDPFADEQPLFTIDANNFAQYAEQLSPGQLAMFRKYPSFKMHVYPSHRDFRYDASVCQAALTNARHAELSADGLTALNAVRGAVPFPFPKSGQELVWNVLMAPGAATSYREADLAIIYTNGNVLWGAHQLWNYSPEHDKKLRGQKYAGVSSYFKISILLPERETGYQLARNLYYDLKEPPYYWATGRCCRGRCQQSRMEEMPLPSAAGNIFFDDMRLMNGSPERYEWKTIGKREFFLPANNFKLEARVVGTDKYAKLITPGHENPDFVRWELRRAWILQGALKEGMRHLYSNRTLYIDEDSYRAAMGENLDTQGNVWRFNWVNNLYVGGSRSNTYESFSAFYHDLHSGNYTALDLTQAKPQSIRIDPPDVIYSKPDYYPRAGFTEPVYEYDVDGHRWYIGMRKLGQP